MRPLLSVLAAIALLAGCGGSDEEQPAAPAADGVRDLASAEPLQQAFDVDAGQPRLLLILSPT